MSIYVVIFLSTISLLRTCVFECDWFLNLIVIEARSFSRIDLLLRCNVFVAEKSLRNRR